MDILIFIQNKELMNIISTLSEYQQFNIKIISNINSSFQNLLKTKFDLMITEINNPTKDYDFCRSIKIHCNDIKILALPTIQLDDENEEKLLYVIDDYLKWPFNVKDLLTKIRIIEKSHYTGKNKPIVLGDLIINPEALEVSRGGQAINLRKKEYELLEFLARNKNMVVNRHTILEYLWNYSAQAMTNTLDVHISNLRKKIDRGYSNKILRTIYGSGYKLCDH